MTRCIKINTCYTFQIANATGFTFIYSRDFFVSFVIIKVMYRKKVLYELYIFLVHTTNLGDLVFLKYTSFIAASQKNRIHFWKGNNFEDGHNKGT